MFEKEAEEYGLQQALWCTSDSGDLRDTFKNGAEFGYNKCKEEMAERLDNATEIIELMKDLFFDCWQEKGLKAIKFEQRVNDFLKGNNYV